MYKNAPARNTEDDSFFQYQLIVDQTIFSGTYSNIYLASHQNHPDYPLIGRVYEPTARIDPQRSSFMRVLNHVGKRSPSCIATWDIFFDDAGRVVIFQEFALHGNLKDYLATNNVYVPEPQMHEWAVQIYDALDFLGDAGICHRNIAPKHILLTPSPDDQNKTIAKLGSFRDSIIYYDPKEDRVRPQHCRPRDGRAQCNFMAPEAFTASKEAASGGGGAGGKEGGKEEKDNAKSALGTTSQESAVSRAQERAPSDASNASRTKDRGGSERSDGKSGAGAEEKKHFDPILADIWAYGATFFFATVRHYPLSRRSHQSGSDPSAAIEKAIKYAKHLSPEAKDWFRGILHGDPGQRFTFAQIAADAWFKGGPKKEGDKKAQGGGSGGGGKSSGSQAKQGQQR